MLYKNFIGLKIIVLSLFVLNNFYNLKPNYANQEIPDLANYLKLTPKENFYILGAGDTIGIKVLEDNEVLDDIFTIAGDGTANLKRLNRVYVSGLTLVELTDLLNKEYKKFTKNPKIKLKVIQHRPVKIYISGAVENPGFYVFKGDYRNFILNKESKIQNSFINEDNLPLNQEDENIDLIFNNSFPSLFYAIRKSGGVSINADIKNIAITRNNSISNGSGKIKTNINLLESIVTNDLSQNIRILDGDTIFVPKHKKPILQEIAKATQTNLNPKFINVFLSGRVNRQGKVLINKGTTLNEAIEIGGGTKVIKGNLVFIRYKNNGEIDRRRFRYKKSAPKASYKNPYLKNGDFIHFEKGAFNASTEVLEDFTSPFQGILSTYGLIKAITGD